MTQRTARWIAWFMVFIYITLAMVGLVLQAITDTPFVQTGLPVLIFLVILIGLWMVIGALIISRHPRHPVGWLLCAGLFLSAIDMFAAGYAAYDTYALSGSLPGVVLALIWLKLVNLGPHGLVAFTLIVLLFPDGHFTSPGWRKVAWITVGALISFLPLQALEPGAADPMFLPTHTNPLGVNASLWSILKPIMWMAFFIMVICYQAAFVSLITRFRNSRGDVKQQSKWLLFPAGLFGIYLLLFVFGLINDNQGIMGLSIAIGQAAISGIVIAMAFAIFKYRLYDIDLLINRTLVYGTLTACVVGVYILAVGTLGMFFQSQGNVIITLLATGIIAVLFQPLRERLQRGVNRLIYGARDDPVEALSRLGRQLELAVPHDKVLPTMVETIAKTLKLPYVAIHLTHSDGDKIAALYGNPIPELVQFPLVYQGETTGKLAVGLRNPGNPFSPAEMRLLQNVARQAGTAVHAVLLTADLRQSRQNLVAAREEERLRLRRDLHDGLGPAIASVIWQADSAREMINADPVEASKLLESSIEQAQTVLSDIRRLVYGLRPPALDELGLVGALEQLVMQNQQISVIFDTPNPFPELPAAVEVAVYRIIMEAIKNAVEHGKAKKCIVSMSFDNGPERGSIYLSICDDGIGFPDVVTPGVGLFSMKQRAEELGGVFSIQPRQTGGIEVVVRLPLEYESLHGKQHNSYSHN